LTPFLIGASSDTPYFLLGYTLIITLGAYVIGIKQKNKILMIASYVLANVSILLAPSAFSIGAIAKLASSVVLGLATLCFLYKQHLTSEVTRIAIGNYVFLFLGSVLVSNGTFTGNTALLTI
jgi:hypothetical protein